MVYIETVNQKLTAVVFIILLVGGLIYVGTAKLKTDSSLDLTPTPTPAALIFDEEKTKNKFQGILPTLSPGSKAYRQFPGVLSEEELKNQKVILETNKGQIVIEILTDAPKAASNFIFLAKDGFYNSLIFHRVVPGFVIQGGDPLGNGTGGPGYMFEDEKVNRKYDRGIVAMANARPNTNGSQFFIMLADHPELPPNYTIFGKVILGMEVVDKIQVGDKIEKTQVNP